MLVSPVDVLVSPVDPVSPLDPPLPVSSLDDAPVLEAGATGGRHRPWRDRSPSFEHSSPALQSSGR
jgi:hypothetical protein